MASCEQVTSIIVNVVGVLYLWNLSAKPTGYEIRINAVSVVNIVMGVGLSVEFVVHIASAFLFTAGNGRIATCSLMLIWQIRQTTFLTMDAPLLRPMHVASL